MLSFFKIKHIYRLFNTARFCVSNNYMHLVCGYFFDVMSYHSLDNNLKNYLDLKLIKNTCLILFIVII